MRKTIYIFFSSIILVSLVMARAISTNCSSTDVVLVVITGIVIEKGEVKKLERLKYFSSFDILVSDPKCEPILELPLVTN